MRWVQALWPIGKAKAGAGRSKGILPGVRAIRAEFILAGPGLSITKKVTESLRQGMKSLTVLVRFGHAVILVDYRKGERRREVY